MLTGKNSSTSNICCSFCKSSKPAGSWKACGSCGKARYCSRKCGQKHWPVHKVACKKTCDRKYGDFTYVPNKPKASVMYACKPFKIIEKHIHFRCKMGPSMWSAVQTIDLSGKELKFDEGMPFLRMTAVPITQVLLATGAPPYFSKAISENAGETITVKTGMFAPGMIIHYWASMPMGASMETPWYDDAYGDYSNTGVVVAGKDGMANFVLLKPQCYKVPSAFAEKSRSHMRTRGGFISDSIGASTLARSSGTDTISEMMSKSGIANDVYARSWADM